MKKYILILLCLITVSGSFAQMQGFEFKFYGQIRTDLYHSSRADEETVDGLFYTYPKDKVRDPGGNDLNSAPNSNFHTLCSCLGVDVAGPELGTAKASAKVEIDFRGTSTSYSAVHLRHIYLNLDWGKSALLLGQNWHPLFEDVSPQTLNLSAGVPFQPFSRAPQICYCYTNKSFQLTGVTIWQPQYTSQGPEGKTHKYLKQSCIPKFYVRADYKSDGLLAGVDIELLLLKPRTESIASTDKYKVDKRITTLSYEAHVKYTNKDWFITVKNILESNLTQASGLSGFGIKPIDGQTGKQEHTPAHFSSSWFNVVCGQKWRPGIFVGYIRNLGASDAPYAPKGSDAKLYGTGTDFDQLVTAGAKLTYNVPHWKFGLEYTLSSAWYGSLNTSSGKIQDTHAVCNNRIVVVVMLMF